MQKKKHKEENSERWLLTYADMLTLLFVLFVLLFAMSNVDAAKYQALAGSLNEALGSGEGAGAGDSIFEGGAGLLDGGASINDIPAETQPHTTSSNTNNTTNNTTNSSATHATEATTKSAEQTQLEGAKGSIDQIISQNNLGSQVSSDIMDSGLVITFPSNVSFDSGKAELKDAMKNALNQIAPELNKLSNQILVKAYTDNIKISNGIYTSNWDLSGDRAVNVVEYLIANCSVSSLRLAAVGCGENDPIASNLTEDGRSQNRRIEIFVPYSSKGIN